MAQLGHLTASRSIEELQDAVRRSAHRYAWPLASSRASPQATRRRSISWLGHRVPGAEVSKSDAEAIGGP